MNEPPWEEGEGWRLLDSTGNVIQSGPPVIAEMATGMGDAFENFNLPDQEA